MKYIDNKTKDILKKLGIVKINEPLKKYTSFKTGGPADIMIWPENRKSLIEIIDISKEQSMPLTVLGGCTNLLVGDRGIRGMALMLNSASKIKGEVNIEGNGLIYADSIIRKDEFIRFCVNAGYEGMEFMAGIPGCIGGGIIMNAGTVDGYFADILESIICMNPDGLVVENTKFKETAGYRAMGLPEDSIVLGGFFKLNKTLNSEKVEIRINDILKERKQKHPLDYPSAGSVFKNPPGHSSWKLINDSGLKGEKIGGACVSELHTNFVINIGNASSQDILNLIDHIKEKVYSIYKITLETEIKIIGDF